MRKPNPSQYKLIRAPSRLQNYVDNFWFGEIEGTDKKQFNYNAIAHSKTQLLFNYQGNIHTENSNEEIKVLPKAGVHGQRNVSQHYFSKSSKVSIFGVNFYPHAIPALFSIPAAELSNMSLDIYSLMSSQGNELTERIFTSASYNERIKLVSDFVESRIKPQSPRLQAIERAIFSIHHSHGRISVDDLVNNSRLSQRQFERSFKELAGFSPKSYLRIVRFEVAVSSFNKTNKSFTELALNAGYFDQSHFNRDFKEYTGLNPSDYFSDTCPI